MGNDLLLQFFFKMLELNGIGADLFVYLGRRFSDSSLVFFFILLGAWLTKVVLGMSWEASNNDAKKGWQRFLKNSKKGGGGYNNLWSSGVLGVVASWSLVTGKRQVRSSRAGG